MARTGIRGALLALTVVSAPAAAQTASGIESSFEQARAVLARSMAAHGGVERIGKLAAVRLQLKADITTGLQQFDHARPCASAANSSRPMRRKRSDAPTATRLGGVRCRSNRFSGVRPIRCQPPGSSRG